MSSVDPSVGGIPTQAVRRCLNFLSPTMQKRWLDASEATRRVVAESIIIEFFSGLANCEEKDECPLLATADWYGAALGPNDLTCPALNWIATVLAQYAPSTYADLFTVAEWRDFLVHGFKPPRCVSVWSALHGALVGWVGAILTSLVDADDHDCWLVRDDALPFCTKLQLRQEVCLGVETASTAPSNAGGAGCHVYFAQTQESHQKMWFQRDRSDAVGSPVVAVMGPMCPVDGLYLTAVRPEVVWPTDVTAVDTATDVHTTILDDACNRATLRQHVDLAAWAPARAIESRVLAKCSALRALYLYPLFNVVKIESGFACECPALTEVDLSGMSSLRTMGGRFLAGCSSLKRVLFIETDGPCAVTSIGHDFLKDCVSLTRVDTGAMKQLQVVENGFLDECRELQYIELPPSIAHVGGAFLRGCHPDANVVVSPDARLQYVGDEFETGHRSMTSFRLAQTALFTRLNAIRDSFMVAYSNLVEVRMPGLTQLTLVGPNFLGNCSALTLVDVSGWSRIATVDAGFCCECTRLRTLDLRGWNSVTVIGDDFCSRCAALSEVYCDANLFDSCRRIGNSFLNRSDALERWPHPMRFVDGVAIGSYFLNESRITSIVLQGKVDSIDEGFGLYCGYLTSASLPLPQGEKLESFLAGCPELASVEGLEGLSDVTEIGNHWFAESALTEIDLRSAVAVRRIGLQFATSCLTVTRIDLRGMVSLTSIGSDFAWGCAGLRTIDLRGLAALATIGESFAVNCATLESISLKGCEALVSVGSDFCAPHSIEDLEIDDVDLLCNACHA